MTDEQEVIERVARDDCALVQCEVEADGHCQRCDGSRWVNTSTLHPGDTLTLGGVKCRVVRAEATDIEVAALIQAADFSHVDLEPDEAAEIYVDLLSALSPKEDADDGR